MGGSSVAVHGLKFSSQNEYLLKYYKFCRIYDNTLFPICKAGISQVKQKMYVIFSSIGKNVKKDLGFLWLLPYLAAIPRGTDG